MKNKIFGSRSSFSFNLYISLFHRYYRHNRILHYKSLNTECICCFHKRKNVLDKLKLIELNEIWFNHIYFRFIYHPKSLFDNHIHQNTITAFRFVWIVTTIILSVTYNIFLNTSLIGTSKMIQWALSYINCWRSYYHLHNFHHNIKSRKYLIWFKHQIILTWASFAFIASISTIIFFITK